jgi:hypothetical protein
MHVEFLEHPEAGTIAREDTSGGEFFLRDDGTVWYRNPLRPDACFVNRDESAFRQAASALQRYTAGVIATPDEAKQMGVRSPADG